MVVKNDRTNELGLYFLSWFYQFIATITSYIAFGKYRLDLDFSISYPSTFLCKKVVGSPQSYLRVPTITIVTRTKSFHYAW